MRVGIDYIGVGVGGVLFNNKHEILLLLRNTHPEKGYWSIPGGRVEFGESIEDAIIREVKEETGLYCNIKSLLGVTNHIVDNMHWISPCFMLEEKVNISELYNLEPHKHLDIRWFGLSKLPDNLTLTTRKAINWIKQLSLVD